ncbi:MAG: hypothetical protein AAF489_12760 [Bacteroidota bacterium]
MTEEEKKILEDRYHRQLNDGHEFRLSQTAFMGALVRYCRYLGKRKMSELDHPKERFKNAFTFNILTIVVLIGIFAGMYYYFS